VPFLLATPLEEQSSSSSLKFKVNACRVKQAYLKASLNSPWRLLHNLHAYLNRMSFFDDFPALDIANILGHSNHVT